MVRARRATLSDGHRPFADEQANRAVAASEYRNAAARMTLVRP
jgi:hypothetical protein